MSSRKNVGIDRRQVLVGGSVGLGGWALSRTSLRPALRASFDAGGVEGRTLVVLQLSGGNDGLSTVVPHGDDGYHRSRRSARIETKDVLGIDGYRGLHPGLKKLKAVYDAGHLAIVEGCGYPEPVRSHFKSLEIWHTGQARGRSSGEGWIGKVCDAMAGPGTPVELAVHIGPNTPYSVGSRAHPAVAFATPEGYRWVATERDDLDLYRDLSEGSGASSRQAGLLDRLRGVLADAQDSSVRVRRAAAGYAPRVAYPQDEFGNSLRAAAALIDARIGTRVISVELGGFDTHNAQRSQHDDRMRRLDAGLGAFLEDVGASTAGQDVVVVAFSEFGRRVEENGSGGTDHGVAGPMFVAGAKVKGGLYGRHPSLSDLVDGDLAMTTDFRSVYGTLIAWLGIDSAKILGASYPKLAIV